MSDKVFSCQDCRRSFASTANEWEIPAYTLKALLNHSSGDVNAGYLSLTERLQQPMQRITEELLLQIGVCNNS